MKTVDFGPFVVAVMAAMVPAGLLVALTRGLRIDMMSVVSLIVPGMTLSVLLISIAMGWIFILFGRLKRTPRWLAGTMVAMGIAMLELLALVLQTTRAG